MLSILVPIDELSLILQIIKYWRRNVRCVANAFGHIKMYSCVSEKNRMKLSVKQRKNCVQTQTQIET